MRLNFSFVLTAALLTAFTLAGCQSSASRGASANAQNSTATNAAGATTQPAASASAAPVASAATASVPPSVSPATAATTGETAHAAGSGGASASAAEPVEPCALLTSDDIKGVQGEAVLEMKPSRRDDPDFRVAQCFYTTPTFTKSVSLELRQRGGGTKSVREFWKELYERAENKREVKNERRKKAGKPQAGPPARPVKGVGDEAYWIGTNANGTLYAFKKESLVRISIGGTDDDASRLRKATTLARKALARL
jgi:hypothetical protein